MLERVSGCKHSADFSLAELGTSSQSKWTAAYISRCSRIDEADRAGQLVNNNLCPGKDGNFEDDEVAVATSVKLPEIREGKFCMIYAHPETLVDNKQVGKLLRSPEFRRCVCCTVVDEVHMISEWGEDFRKAFSKLGELTCVYPEIPHLALTATATPVAIQTLSKILQFQKVTKVTENSDRPNIYLEIKERLPNVKKYEKYNEILQPLCEELQEKMLDFPVTIVYCDSLESVGYSYQYVDDQLQAQQYVPMEDQIPENRIFAQYHKGYTDKMKNLTIFELQKENPKLRLVFATVALGMGLNSPSVARIIHFRPPTTLEKYVQEIGRAGRSGQEAHALVYYNNSDVASNRKGLKVEVKQQTNAGVMTTLYFSAG
ncbi:Werner syndrome ATP-dependent helicase homolog [Pecten maximus]|uniref:Werner syndrome ATP-dependent helicase homolog n=1 Tax=Pecten maximus TaxID=6579 RepID=UPI00145911E6|nr:Werner syndrome ATP-dependent helicase homolog [Pecten maximus]